MNQIMVCLDDSTQCTVHDTTPGSTQRKISIVVRPNQTIENVISNVSTQFSQYDEFELVLQPQNKLDASIFLNTKKDKILYQLPGFLPKSKNILVLSPVGTWEEDPKKKIDLDNSSSSMSPLTPDGIMFNDGDGAIFNDDLALGASASPTNPDSLVITDAVRTSEPFMPLPPASQPPLHLNTSRGPTISPLGTNPVTKSSSSNKSKLYSSSSSSSGYIGLVNQEMTCYLNSLLQALFMTPEFRNALYKIEFNENDKIPYQLQKLFLNLQTSNKPAVETNSLIKCFGFGSRYAWEEHDIQEVRRVMFDALENKLKNIKQANSINRLYEGKMIDYVKCLDCLTEKSREDTFLDIPLPVKPFGGTITYGSIEEALRAFVQPETLDGSNQYFCENCNKKRDAHKGLKFKTFPYILTLHLKRFDFDYQTLHRIKVNDKVTFPQNLNLNGFINVTDVHNSNNGHSNGFSMDKCNTTSTGSAMEEDNCGGASTKISSSRHKSGLLEGDDDIDMSSNATENRTNNNITRGPYIYDLFAIMINSGSASGGHYYAYIKEFENHEWYCFKDQTVTTISQEDIEKSFGGGSLKARNSSLKSSSTNAYMLMYRQNDPKRNESSMKRNDFPEHIKNLVERLNSEEELNRTNRNNSDDNSNVKVIFLNPNTKHFEIKKCYRDFGMDSILESSFKLFKIQQRFNVPLSRCRLIAYDHTTDAIECSFEGKNESEINNIIQSLAGTDFLLEVREPDAEFENYEKVMVCLDLGDSTQCIVHDTTPGSIQRKISIVVQPNQTIENVISNVSTQFSQYDEFELVLQPQNKLDASIFLNTKKDKILYQLPGFLPKSKNILVLSPVGTWEQDPNKKIDLDISLSSMSPLTPDGIMFNDGDGAIFNDDLALGASASPTDPDSLVLTDTVRTSEPFMPLSPAPPPPPYSSTASVPTISPIGTNPVTKSSSSNKLKLYSSSSSSSGYVGLVNQAMTCYLNSLLQALFMTPEFRNALYKIEFNENDKIPYQLQKLFLNLQTSNKPAVETTDLTKSFGWGSRHAWQQHDIQELCRVMFDALENKFKNTKQANLINILYEGKMIDYVKCLDCLTEKSREDTFLDIPLPVKPFGGTITYGSIEEALRAFVQPETLDGSNQYFCEKCNKKRDAHKGLKFKTFPYILTLHLKRFDFDYQTLHRIKLNDKVTFPQNLNLNGFINVTDAGTFSNYHSSNNGHSNGFSVDDCNTTSSGSAMEEDNCSGASTKTSSSHHESELLEDDDDIDMSSNTTENRTNNNITSGPYIYDLFAIMIHSGSASGGHYYAYIKEFENNEWYCFNDQTVTTISQEDIEKSFGGGSFKAYYSSVYSSSTNAYMLMYRQNDPKRNESSMKRNDFPEHIKNLVERLNSEEELNRTNRNNSDDNSNVKVFFLNPNTKHFEIKKCYRDFGIDSILESSFNLFKIQQRFNVPLSRCRLIAYDHTTDEIECSFEGKNESEINNIIQSLAGTDFLLEVREPDEEFERYEKGGVTLKVFIIDYQNNVLTGPHYMRGYKSEKQEGLKKTIAKKLKLNSKDIFIPKCTFVTGAKIFVIHAVNAKLDENSLILERIVENFSNLTYLYIVVPPVEKQTLDILGIFPWDSNVDQQKMVCINGGTPSHEIGGGDVVDAVMMNGLSVYNNDVHDRACSSPTLISLSQGSSSTGSNSEDNSLSDGDRTLVEESTQVPCVEFIENLLYTRLFNNGDTNSSNFIINPSGSDDEDDMEIARNSYFRIIPEKLEYTLENGYSSDTEDYKPKNDKPRKVFKVFVDKNTKLNTFNQLLGRHINIPAEYFTVQRCTENRLKSSMLNTIKTLAYFKEGEFIKIELGRIPKRTELKTKVFFMRRSDLSNEVGKITQVCEHIFHINTAVIDVKKQLIAQLHRIDSKQYGNLNLENCRLWEKEGRNPVRILQNVNEVDSTSKLLSGNCELVVEECEKGYPTETPEDSLTLFVRRWHPSTLQLDGFEEITLEKNDDVKKALAAISNIPEEHIAYSKMDGSFPYTSKSLLTLNSSGSWFIKPATKECYPLYSSMSGNVYCYKNTLEEIKELTVEERKEFNTKENSRLERIGCGYAATTSLYSPRQERALKIYLDSPPKSNFFKDE